MKIGVPTEVKQDEYRVAITPAGVRELTARGHEVVIQAGAGEGSGVADADYSAQGAAILADAAAVFATAETIVKVKEPQPPEVAMLESHHTLFTYLHLAPDAELTQGLLDSGATCIAYETVTDHAGRLPLLAPMSEVAGKIATQAGAFMLERPLGGAGLLLGGVPGVAAGRVMVIGGGIVGTNAARIAVGLGAEVMILDRSLERLRELDTIFDGAVSTVYASSLEIESRLPEADLVIGAVLVKGAKAPHVVDRAQLGLMKERAVLVDVSIDQGGCFETSRPTTHTDPVYAVDGVSHYCVANMPGAVPITSTRALTNATLSYVVRLAEEGVATALSSDPGFLSGLSVRAGHLTDEAVARDQGRPRSPAAEALGLAASAAWRNEFDTGLIDHLLGRYRGRPCPTPPASDSRPASPIRCSPPGSTRGVRACREGRAGAGPVIRPCRPQHEP
jgi:alanine dehydrogenase